MTTKTLIIGLLLVSVLMCGCVENEKTYTHEDKQLVLYSDGRYAVCQDDSFGGDYRIIGGDLYLLTAWGSFKLTRDRDAWVDQDGDRWSKE